MAKSQDSFNKKEKEKKRLKKRQDKQLKKEERRSNSAGGGLENMMAYVDENGMITDTPPDPTKKKKVILAKNIEIGVPRREAEDEVSATRTGKIDFFNSTKGFGFIKEDGTQEKYFVHISSISEELSEGEKVTFEIEKGPKGLNAVRVKKA